MQRVVRSTFVGILAIASLTACGDKVTVPQGTTTVTAADSSVHSVTVSPPAVTMNIGDKVTLAASVDAGAGVADRTVTWSSSSTSIATVDANGVVTAVASGNATIIASSKANPAVRGAAAVTVNAAGAIATVTISSINHTVCGTNNVCSSVPANLGATTGQLDVVLNVDPGSQKLAGVDLIMNCNAAANFPTTSDTVVATQSLTGTNVAPVAEAASAPVTLSFNTASFNSTTGATSFKNGACVLRARARTTTGTTVASSTQTLTLANQDVVIGNLSATASAQDQTGLTWNGGNVTVSVIPVFYTAGRAAATTSITFEGKQQTLTNASGAAVSATFIDGNDFNSNTPAALGPTDIDNITDADAMQHLTVSVIDASGNSFNTNPCAQLCSSQSVLAGAPASIFPSTAPFRLDTQKPTPGTLAITNNSLQRTGTSGYLGSNFRFVADSAAGFRGPNANTAVTNVPSNTCAGNSGGFNPVTCNSDNGGVDKVTVQFFSVACTSNCSSSSTFTAVTNTSGLNETNTGSSLSLVQITKDALGNADTAFATGSEFDASGKSSNARFGVDKTAPTVTQVGGPANNAANRDSSRLIQGTGNYQFSIGDNLSGTNGISLVAQTSLTSGISISTFNPPAENTVFSNGTENTAGPCVIGRWNSTAAAAAPNALQAFDRGGNLLGFCSPTPYALLALGGGNVSIPANEPGAVGTGNREGYFTTEVIAIDLAGNQAAPVVKTVVEDQTAPTITNIDAPGSITGNSTATVSAAVADNVDVTASTAAITYNAPSNGGAAITLRYPPTAGPGVSFDNVLTRSATATPQIPNFIKNLQLNNGTAGVTAAAAGGNATSITVIAFDEVGNQSAPGGSATFTFAPTTTFNAGASSSFSTTTFTAGFNISANTSLVSDCPAAGCGAPAGSVAAANPTSVTLTATAGGTTATFNNPFAGGAVEFWYATAASAPSNTWFFIGNGGAANTRDNGVNRFWDYTLSWTPPKVAIDGTVLTGGASVQVRAIGVNTNGDGVESPAITITLTNP